MEQAATDGATADNQDQDEDQAKATRDGANPPGDRSAPVDEDDDHADQEGRPTESDCLLLCILFALFLLACTGRRDPNLHQGAAGIAGKVS